MRWSSLVFPSQAARDGGHLGRPLSRRGGRLFNVNYFGLASAI